MLLNFLILLGACALYGAVHSLLASHGFKAWAKIRLGPNCRRWYRLFYNLVGGITLLPLALLFYLLPDSRLYVIPFPFTLVTLGLQGLAFLGLLVGVCQTGAMHFLGFAQLLYGESEERPDKLVTGGLYRYMRHPLYTLGLIFLWLTPLMTWNVLALALGLTGYVFVGALLEERKLEAEFGEAYWEYKKRVPMLVPRFVLHPHEPPKKDRKDDDQA